jgi:F0F1-type ATP synthase assembly protein I
MSNTSPLPTPPPAHRWPTGLATLIGVGIGALGGWIAGLIPVGMTAGLALGVAVDSLLNIRRNGAPALMEGSRISDDA